MIHRAMRAPSIPGAATAEFAVTALPAASVGYRDRSLAGATAQPRGGSTDLPPF